MFLEDFCASNENKKLSKLIKSLDEDFGIDISIYENLSSAELISFLSDLESKKSQIMLESEFNTYHADPDYAKVMLLSETLRMLLKEIHPKRSRKAKKVDETLDYKVHPDTGAAVDHDIDEDAPRPDLYWHKHQWEDSLDGDSSPVEAIDAPEVGKAYSKDWDDNNPDPDELHKEKQEYMDSYAPNRQPVGGTGENEQQAGGYVAVMNPNRFLGDEDVNIMSIEPNDKSQNEVSPLSRKVSRVMVDADEQTNEDVDNMATVKITRFDESVSIINSDTFNNWNRHEQSFLKKMDDLVQSGKMHDAVSEIKQVLKNPGHQTDGFLDELTIIGQRLLGDHGGDIHADEGVNRKPIDSNIIKGLSGLLESTLLNENELQRAEIVFATNDLVMRLGKMIEDLSKMGTDDIMPLVDGLRENFGPQVAEKFSADAEVKIQDAANGIDAMKQILDRYREKFEGRISDEDAQQPIDVSNLDNGAMAAGMGADLPADDMAADDGLGDLEGDDLGLGDLGGEEEEATDEPLGRALKESKIVSIAGKKVKLTLEQIEVLHKAKQLTEKINVLNTAAIVDVPCTTFLNVKGKKIRISESQLKSLLFAKKFKQRVDEKKANAVKLSESQAKLLVEAKLLTQKIGDLVK